MATYCVYKVTDKKCATCSYWSGSRSIQIVAYKPTYINAEAASRECIAMKNRKYSAVNTCPSWKKWEKI